MVLSSLFSILVQNGQYSMLPIECLQLPDDLFVSFQADIISNAIFWHSNMPIMQAQFRNQTSSREEVSPTCRTYLGSKLNG